MPGITQAVPTSFKLECLKGIHDFTTDVFKMALFDASIASLDATTLAYSATGEITGTGYTAAGAPMAIVAGWPQIFGTTYAGARFDPQIWTAATFFADGALIYNSSKANRAVLVLSFPARQSPFAGTFTVNFPTSLDPVVNLK